MEPLLLLCLVVILALVFDFTNGFHDAANAIATVVSTRVLRPRTAVMYAATLNLAGALLGTEVAKTVGSGLVDAFSITIHTVLCTLVAAICWNLITWYKGLPTSSSHALIGSLLGASYFSSHHGWENIHVDQVLNKVILPMMAAPLTGFIVGFLLMLGLTWLVFRQHLHRINFVFGKLQILSAGFMALSHGMSDAQKSMGIIALALLLTYPPANFAAGSEMPIPLWVKISCAAFIGLGTAMGGWRIVRTLGSRVIKLQPIHGFACETTASLVLATTAHFGIPLSTTQVISSAIMGVGATRRFSAVRWGIVGNIVWAWVLTLPLTFVFAGCLMWLLLRVTAA